MHLAGARRIAAEIAHNYALPVSTLGKTLQRIRESRGEEQQDVAQRMGVKYNQLSNWENDRYSNIQLKTLLALAFGYRCTVDELIAGFHPKYAQFLRGDL